MSRIFSTLDLLRIFGPSFGSDKTLREKLLYSIPIMGSSKEFVDALGDFQLARLQGDKAKIKLARLNGLTALLDAGIDVSLLFALTPAARAFRAAATSLYFGRVGRYFGVNEFDISEPLASRLLTIPGIPMAVDTIFETARRAMLKPLELQAAL